MAKKSELRFVLEQSNEILDLLGFLEKLPDELRANVYSDFITYAGTCSYIDHEFLFIESIPAISMIYYRDTDPQEAHDTNTMALESMAEGMSEEQILKTMMENFGELHEQMQEDLRSQRRRLDELRDGTRPIEFESFERLQQLDEGEGTDYAIQFQTIMLKLAEAVVQADGKMTDEEKVLIKRISDAFPRHDARNPS